MVYKLIWYITLFVKILLACKCNILPAIFLPYGTVVNYEFTIQMGVPTEYQQRHNALRKRKFQQILYMAAELADAAESLALSNAHIRHSVDRIFETLLAAFQNKNIREVSQAEWNAIIQAKRVSVFPETAFSGENQ